MLHIYTYGIRIHFVQENLSFVNAKPHVPTAVYSSYPDHFPAWGKCQKSFSMGKNPLITDNSNNFDYFCQIAHRHQ